MSITKIIVTSTDTDYQVPGLLSVAQITSAYSSSIPGLSNMVANTSDSTVDGVTTRTVTFSPRTGTKGASLTKIVVTSTDTDYQVPGLLSVAQITSAYSSSIPGLSNMVASESTATDGDGNIVKTVTFSPRTGTKG